MRTLQSGIPWIGVFFSNLIIHKHMDGPCQSFIFIFLCDLFPLLTVRIVLSIDIIASLSDYRRASLSSQCLCVMARSYGGSTRRLED